MKKMLIIVLTAFYIFTSMTPSWAAGESNGTDDSAGMGEPAGKVEITFKVGDGTLKINGKNVNVVRPFVSNGVTLVPIRVITEAFGAQIEWNGEERSFVIVYGDVTIKLFIDSIDGMVNGRAVKLPEAPAVVSGTTMVPLRFITENFGADVVYNSQSLEITVIKEIASSTSIKDFSLVLKKTDKLKVGDSYYKWSMSLPKDLKIARRNFNGTYNLFAAADESYYIEVIVNKLESETMDSLMATMLEYAKDYTIISYAKEKNDDQEYVKFIYKDSSFTYEDRKYIKNGNIYTLQLYVKDYNTYKGSSEIPKLLDSFTASFVKTGTEDLSDVTADGYRPYEDKKLKWSVKVLADWSEYKDSNKDNEVWFSDDKTGFYLGMFSIENGLTLESWVEDELKQIADEYNPELVKVLKVEEAVFNGVNGKKLYTGLNVNGSMKYQCDMYVLGKNYKYHLTYWTMAEAYNDATQKAKIEGMLDSFKLSQPNAEEIGQLLDPSGIKAIDGVRKLESKNFKWSFDLPLSWTAKENNNDGDYICYGDSNTDIGIEMTVLKNGTADTVATYIENYMKENATTYTIDKKEFISDKGTTVIKYTYTLVSGDMVGKRCDYILAKNGYVYAVTLGVKEIKYNARSRQQLQTIWNSMRFE